MILFVSLDGKPHFETKYSSKQAELFEVCLLREPIEEIRAERKSLKKGLF
jgi:hypothetical protein